MELITRQLEPSGEIVEAFRIDGGPRVELPLDSPVLVRYEAGGSIGVVTTDIFAGRVRFIDRADVETTGATAAVRSLYDAVKDAVEQISPSSGADPTPLSEEDATALILWTYQVLRDDMRAAGLDGSSK